MLLLTNNIIIVSIIIAEEINFRKDRAMSEMTKQGYSYDFDMFSEQGREKELKRLYTQATIAK